MCVWVWCHVWRHLLICLDVCVCVSLGCNDFFFWLILGCMWESFVNSHFYSLCILLVEKKMQVQNNQWIHHTSFDGLELTSLYIWTCSVKKIYIHINIYIKRKQTNIVQCSDQLFTLDGLWGWVMSFIRILLSLTSPLFAGGNSCIQLLDKQLFSCSLFVNWRK